MGLVQLTEAQQEVLDRIAGEQLRRCQPASARTLRLKGVDVDTVVPALPSGLLDLVGSPPPREAFRLTLKGWLRSDAATEIELALDSVVKFLQHAISADPDSMLFTWKGLKEYASVTDDSYAFHFHAVKAARLPMPTLAPGRKEFTLAPPPEEYLMEFMRWSELDDVLKHLRWCDSQVAAAGKLGAMTRLEQAEEQVVNVAEEESQSMGNSVFVVHGHDERAREALKSFLQNIGLRFFSWGHAKKVKPGLKSNHEAVRIGIEKADALVVLFTPDELASRRPELPGKVTTGYQPRPNVIFEAGWAFGAHADKTVIVEVGGLHRLSDIDGVQTVRMSGVQSLNDLANELGTIGLPVDLADSSWNDVSKYPGLFQDPPELASDHVVASGPEGTEAYDDETLLLLQRDKLPNVAQFYTFVELDKLSGLPAGTAGRFAARAAEQLGCLERKTKFGVSLAYRSGSRRA